MASSKLMASSASRDSDLKRKLSACSSAADFLRIDSSSSSVHDNSASDAVKVEDFLRNSFVERNQSPNKSNSSTLLNAEITLLDSAGAVAPISEGEVEPSRKTVDDVWREIVAGKTSEKKPKEEMMTLEDFLVKAGAVDEETSKGVVEVKEERMSSGIFGFEKSNSAVIGVGVDVGGLGRGRGKRSMSLLEPLDKAAQQRQRRMIKNRESAARSRERKQAYQVELESMAVRLEEEKELLLKEKNHRMTLQDLKDLYPYNFLRCIFVWALDKDNELIWLCK